ncbi:MAG: MFS transporter [Actinomycetota bacterium]|nr:MFS transporter [Actinomycetota bacterium]
MTDVAEKESKKPKVRLGANYWKLWSSSVVSNLGDGVAIIAYPWLASAITRNAVLIALIAVVQRLPWLLFTLPAGVITDRVDRRKLMLSMNVLRTVITIVVAIVVFGQSSTLPVPDEITAGMELTTNWILYITLVVAALLFGMAEVLYDNAAQTILPAIVEPEGLERANGNLWGAEMVMNSFIGPPLGSVLIGVAFALPFFFDAGSFAISAVLLLFVAGTFRVDRDETDLEAKVDWWGEIKEGVTWLWRHPLLRPMAIILGFLNALASVVFATFVLYAQEVLGVTAFVFAILGAAGAIGGVLGSVLAPRISKAIGSGASLYTTFIAMAVTTAIIGLTSNWVVAFVAFAVSSFFGVLWNVITVSLRQTIIPDHLLGRVNSVYRFFAWGMMPIGLAVGGLLVSGVELAGGSRELALRLPWFLAALSYLLLFAYAAPKLTTAKIEAARAEGVAAKEAEAAMSVDDTGEFEVEHEAIAEAGIPGAVPPEIDDSA